MGSVEGLMRGYGCSEVELRIKLHSASKGMLRTQAWSSEDPSCDAFPLSVRP